MKEADLCELILENVHVLTCFNCGDPLESKIVYAKRRNKLDDNRTAVAMLHIDSGESNYPREPDISASAYFECMKCTEEHQPEFDDRILELAETNNIVHTGITLARCDQLSEKETLIQLVQALAGANETLFDDLIRIRHKGPAIGE